MTVTFLAKLDVGHVDDARQSKRLFVRRLASLLIGRDHRLDVIVHDISERGFLAEFTSHLQVGDEVRLHVATIGYVRARIVWKRGLGHGCEFAEPVSPGLIGATIATAARAGNDRNMAIESSVHSAGIKISRSRLWQERFGALAMFACMAVALGALATALVGILFE
jgi:hypothetical protein